MALSSLREHPENRGTLPRNSICLAGILFTLLPPFAQFPLEAAGAERTSNRRCRAWNLLSRRGGGRAVAPAAVVAGAKRWPGDQPPARRRSRNTNFWILPDGVRGNSSTTRSSSGHFCRARPASERWALIASR